MEKKTKILTLITYIFIVYLNQNKVSGLATVRMSNGNKSHIARKKNKYNIYSGATKVQIAFGCLFYHRKPCGRHFVLVIFFHFFFPTSQFVCMFRWKRLNTIYTFGWIFKLHSTCSVFASVCTHVHAGPDLSSANRWIYWK